MIAIYLLAIVPADFVMSRQMLRGIKSRGERTGSGPLSSHDGTNAARRWA